MNSPPKYTRNPVGRNHSFKDMLVHTTMGIRPPSPDTPNRRRWKSMRNLTPETSMRGAPLAAFGASETLHEEQEEDETEVEEVDKEELNHRAIRRFRERMAIVIQDEDRFHEYQRLIYQNQLQTHMGIKESMNKLIRQQLAREAVSREQDKRKAFGLKRRDQPTRLPTLRPGGN